jgi:S1-C subfamily serine protease
VIASEPSADVALLELERIPSEPVVAPLGDSDAVEVGDEIFIVGAPFGLSHTLTVGHISGRRNADKLFGGFSEAEMFQTDAAINQGNSGGPMFNRTGEVIGIVSSIISRSGGFEGLGFVITSNLARQLVVDERSPWSGMEGFLLSGDLARIFNLPQPMGVLVQKVVEGSMAASVGLRPGTIKAVIADQELLLGGDVVLSVMGLTISKDSRKQIRTRMRGLTPASPITVKVLRGGRPVELSYDPTAR